MRAFFWTGQWQPDNHLVHTMSMRMWKPVGKHWKTATLLQQ